MVRSGGLAETSNGRRTYPPLSSPAAKILLAPDRAVREIACLANLLGPFLPAEWPDRASIRALDPQEEERRNRGRAL